MKKNLIVNIAIILFLLSAILPDILPAKFKSISLIISIGLVLYSVFQYFSSSKREQANTEMMDIMNSMLFDSTGKSPYFKKLVDEIFVKGKGFSLKIKSEIEREINLNPKNLDAVKLHLLGRLQYFMNVKSVGYKIRGIENHLKDLLKDLKNFEKVYKLDSVFFHQSYGIVYDFLGEYKKAQTHFKKIQNVNSIMRLQLAESLMMSDDIGEAMKILENETQNPDKSWGVDFKLGQIYFDIGMSDEAIPLLKKAKKNRPYHTEVRNQLANAYLFSEFYWKSTYETLRLIFSGSRFFSFKIFGKNLIKFFFHFMMAIYFNLGQLTQFVGRNLLILNRVNNIIYRRDYMLRLRASKALESARLDVAIALLEKSIYYCPSRADNYNDIAICFYLAGNSEKSFEYLDKGVLLKDKYKSILLSNREKILENLISGASLFLNQINIERMIKLLNKTTNDPTDEKIN